MRLGMMQPYFFPYVGYFSLIHATDYWVVFDTAQYRRRAWVNRNRMLSDNLEGWNYIRIPVTHSPRETRICDIRIDDTQAWIDQLIDQLQIYRQRRAPYYGDVIDWLRAALHKAHGIHGHGDFSRTLIDLLEETCRHINLPFPCQIFSQMNLNLPDELPAGEWALEVARSLGAETYINAPGGRELFSPRQFSEASISLQILKPRLTAYRQGCSQFIPGLSILDLLMWNSTAETLELVTHYDLESLTSEPQAQ
jgi:hypothetical protein